MKKLYLFSRVCEWWYKLTPRKIRRFWLASALLALEDKGSITLENKLRTLANKELKGKIHPSWIKEDV